MGVGLEENFLTGPPLEMKVGWSVEQKSSI